MVMKYAIGAVLIAVCIYGIYLFTRPSHTSTNTMDTTINSPVTVVPIEHATGYLQWGDDALYFDPIGDAARFAALPKADMVLVTDIHGDHFSTSTLEAVIGSSTVLIVPQAVQEQLPETLAARAIVLHNGEETSQLGYVVSAVPMYNLPDADNSSLHPKGRGNGYIIEKEGFRVYIAGDTAGTPEMRALTGIDIALVPMNPPYTMSVGEAADAVLAFKPRAVYPYHYRSPDGLADVARFKSMVEQAGSGIEVVLAQWYPAQ
jgi:L-ascorbate metabolism protein UlaG (beta-lactamase superfamily)